MICLNIASRSDGLASAIELIEEKSLPVDVPCSSAVGIRDVPVVVPINGAHELIWLPGLLGKIHLVM